MFATLCPACSAAFGLMAGSTKQQPASQRISPYLSKAPGGSAAKRPRTPASSGKFRERAHRGEVVSVLNPHVEAPAQVQAGLAGLLGVEDCAGGCAGACATHVRLTAGGMLCSKLARSNCQCVFVVKRPGPLPPAPRLQRMEVEGAATCAVEVLGEPLAANAKYMMNRIEDKVGKNPADGGMQDQMRVGCSGAAVQCALLSTPLVL